MPSALGSTPDTAKRNAWTVRKDIARLSTSFSDSTTSSRVSFARVPFFRAPPRNLLLHSRTMPRRWNTASRKVAVRSIAARDPNAFCLNGCECCKAPPARIAAKPAMCARSVAQHLIRSCLSSRSYWTFWTVTSMLCLSRTTLFWASLFPLCTARTWLSSATFSPKDASIESPMTHENASRSVTSELEAEPEMVTMEAASRQM
mmetsp:Transcript_41044/g.108428  ORF Transcript_41044/g.108428 Transcript_41044/m.108428 type:complete len:203 (-) Transcript_41044:250-858(-)